MCVTEVIILFVWALVLFLQVKMKKNKTHIILCDEDLLAVFLRLHKWHEYVPSMIKLLLSMSQILDFHPCNQGTKGQMRWQKA